MLITLLNTRVRKEVSNIDLFNAITITLWEMKGKRKYEVITYVMFIYMVILEKH